MPPAYLYDITGIDLDHVLLDQEAIRQVNPQRGDMEHLNAIVWAGPAEGKLIGYKDVRENEFWVPGHIPGRPLLPGVIQIEAAAQLASFYAKTYKNWQGFIGFGGVEKCKFRQPVMPGCRLHLIGIETACRHGRMYCDVQGLVKGTVAFECSIIGMQM